MLSQHATFLLGQGPTYAILFAYMRVAPSLNASMLSIIPSENITKQRFF